MAANNYFTFSDWKQAVTIAKCCIAKKQAYQVLRESNLMGRCLDTEAEVAFLQSSLYLLNNYTYEGNYNQITDEECLELIGRIQSICNCENEPPYPVQDICGLSAICVSGTYIEDGGDPVTIAPQTVTPDSNCVFIFDIEDPIDGDITYVLQQNNNVYELTTGGELLDSNEKIIGNYSYSIGTTDYSLTVVSGACS